MVSFFLYILVNKPFKKVKLEKKVYMIVLAVLEIQWNKPKMKKYYENFQHTPKHPSIETPARTQQYPLRAANRIINFVVVHVFLYTTVSTQNTKKS